MQHTKLSNEYKGHTNVDSVLLRKGKILEKCLYFGAIICQVESKKTGDILWETTMTTQEYIDLCKEDNADLKEKYMFNGSMLDYFKRSCWMEDVVVHYLKH